MPHLQATTSDAVRLLHDGALALGRAEQAGMRIDVDYCRSKRDELEDRLAQLERNFRGTNLARHWQHYYGGKFNLKSNHQLARILYGVRKITPARTTESGQGSTDEEALRDLGIPELNDLIEYRKLDKIKSTYFEAILREQVGGVLRPFFNLNTVITYRSSSNAINFQNIPVRDEESMQLVRRAFLPRRGRQLLEVDYGGIEVRVACCYTRDERLIHDTLHGDMHRDMAIELYALDGLDKHHAGEKNLRQGAKNGFVFPQFYGDYYGNCAPNLLKWARAGTLRDGTPALVHLKDKGLVKLDRKGEVRDAEDFTEHVKAVEDDFWNRRYKAYTEWKESWWEEYQRRGFIEMLTGFRCGGVMSRKDVVNYPIQGSAFHCLLWSFIEIDRIAREEGWDSRLIGQVHDSMLSDTHPDELEHVAETIRRVTCTELPKAWPWIIVPLEIEADLCPINQPWSEKAEYELEA